MPMLPGGEFVPSIFAQGRIEGHLRMAETFKRLGKERGDPQHIIDRLVADELASAKIYQDASEAEQ